MFDDGTGPGLYVGGYFTTSGDMPANHVAKWDGTAWTTLDTGVNDTVFAVSPFCDANGPALFVGGVFSMTSGLPATHIAKWGPQ